MRCGKETGGVWRRGRALRLYLASAARGGEGEGCAPHASVVRAEAGETASVQCTVRGRHIFGGVIY